MPPAEPIFVCGSSETCDRCLPAGSSVTEDVIVRWKTMVVEGQKRGHTFGQPDLFIAAIAALQGLVVVSRDVSEFVEAGVPVFDPWVSALYFDRRKSTVRTPATVELVTKTISKS